MPICHTSFLFKADQGQNGGIASSKMARFRTIGNIDTRPRGNRIFLMGKTHSVGHKHIGSSTGSHSNGKVEKGELIPVCLSQILWLFDQFFKNWLIACAYKRSLTSQVLRDFPELCCYSNPVLLDSIMHTLLMFFQWLDQFCLPSWLYMALIVSCVIHSHCHSSFHSVYPECHVRPLVLSVNLTVLPCHWPHHTTSAWTNLISFL